MTGAEAGRVVSMLNAYFPRDALEPESMAVWVQEVARLTSYDDAVAAARTIGRTGDRFPHVSEFLATYRAKRSRPTLRELEETTSIEARPVWARYLRRVELVGATLGMDVATMLPPPTDAEKHDAILVLQAAWDGEPSWVKTADALMTEAQRIMDESS